jgi:hypothetical protein
MKLLEMGDVTARTVVRNICEECGREIEIAGMCSYGCPEDGKLSYDREQYLRVQVQIVESVITVRKIAGLGPAGKVPVA